MRTYLARRPVRRLLRFSRAHVMAHRLDADRLQRVPCFRADAFKQRIRSIRRGVGVRLRSVLPGNLVAVRRRARAADLRPPGRRECWFEGCPCNHEEGLRELSRISPLIHARDLRYSHTCSLRSTTDERTRRCDADQTPSRCQNATTRGGIIADAEDASGRADRIAS